MGKIRIKDIADLAKVSIGTVDRVIHNRGQVSEDTARRIRKLLEEMNYTPDIKASSLALKREIKLAVLMPGFVNEHAFWKMPMKGIEKCLHDLSDYRLKVDMFYFDQFSPEDFIKRIKDFPFDTVHGVLFAPVFLQDSLEFLKRCKAHELPVVLFNSSLEEGEYSAFVGQDALQSGKVAGRLMNYGLEHRRDVLIVNLSARKDNYAHLVNREKGFRAYFEDNRDLVDRLVSIDLNGVNEWVLEEKLNKAFERYNIGGVFVSNSRVYKVAEYLERHGEINTRLVGFDLMPESMHHLKKGSIDFLLSQQPEVQASQGLLALFNLVAFNSVPERNQYMPIDIITKENLEYYKPDQGQNNESIY